MLSLQALHVRPHTLHRAERRLLRAAADCGVLGVWLRRRRQHPADCRQAQVAHRDGQPHGGAGPPLPVQRAGSTGAPSVLHAGSARDAELRLRAAAESNDRAVERSKARCSTRGGIVLTQTARAAAGDSRDRVLPGVHDAGAPHCTCALLSRGLCAAPLSRLCTHERAPAPGVQKRPTRAHCSSPAPGAAEQPVGEPLRDLSPYSLPTPCARAARQVLDMIEHGFAKRGINLTTLPARLLYRSAYVVLISFVACTIPFFGVRGGHPPARLACAGHVQSWDTHAPRVLQPTELSVAAMWLPRAPGAALCLSGCLGLHTSTVRRGAAGC